VQYEVLIIVKCGILSECEKTRWVSDAYCTAETGKLRQDRNVRVEVLIHKVRGWVLMREREVRHMAIDKESWSWKVACLDRARYESLYTKMETKQGGYYRP
jgi:hypothetical protein